MRAASWITAVMACLSVPVVARPIVYPQSTTLMMEHAGGDFGFDEIQLFYAPKYWFSWGVGHMDLDNGADAGTHRITYLRLNFLAKRWNLEAAQANFFAWGGAGQARFTEWIAETAVPGDDDHDHGPPPPNVPAYERTIRDTAWNAGAQVDFETRRIYTSFKTDLHLSSGFEHRSDLLQFGVAPYEHDMDTWATWLVLAGRRHSGDMYDGTEVSLLLRLFKNRTWLEAGVTTDGAVQARAMFSL